MIVLNIIGIILIELLILAMSLLKLGPLSPRLVMPAVWTHPKSAWGYLKSAYIYLNFPWTYLKSGPLSLTFAVLLCAVEVAVAVTGTREQFRSEYGLPNDNLWAYTVYAFLHAGSMHLLENVGALLICGGIVEERIESRWFLALLASSVPLGGFLVTMTAPVFIDAPWTGDAPSVGFSIVAYAILVLCSYFAIDLVWKERLRLVSEIWMKSSAIVIGLYLVCSFATGLSNESGESNLGHCIGMALGIVVVAVQWFGHRVRGRNAG